MTNPTPHRSDESKRLPVGMAYFALLAATVFLLIVATVSLLIGLALGLESDADPLPGGGKKPAVTTPSTDEKTPVSPTVPTRDSYLFVSDSNTTAVGETEIASDCTILVSLETYTALAERNADMKVYPASMIKVMSLLIACEQITDMNETVTVAAEDVYYAGEIGGSGIGLKVGEELTVEDLLYLTSYQSDTIAVLTLAKHLAGREEAFVAQMNQKAAALGLTNTSFANCTGLHHENNYTTCREMATIMAYALENPKCREVLTSTGAYVIENNFRKKEDNTRLMIYSGWYSRKDRFADNAKLKTVTVSGGKTGYEDIPTATFVTYAKDGEGKGYINVLIGRTDTAQNAVSASQSTKDAKYMYNTYVS